MVRAELLAVLAAAVLDAVRAVGVEVGVGVAAERLGVVAERLGVAAVGCLERAVVGRRERVDVVFCEVVEVAVQGMRVRLRAINKICF